MPLEKEPSGSFFCVRSAGFTIAEMVTVAIIIGTVMAVVLPKFSSSSSAFDDIRLYDDTVAALRYAQRAATAMQRTVCVNFPTTKQLTLTYDSNYNFTGCSPGLQPPYGGGGTYTVNAQGAAAYSGAAGFRFDRVGRPSTTPISITIGSRSITVENETGYVH